MFKKKVHDTKTPVLEEKIKNLSFWQDIQDGPVAEPTKEKKEKTNAYQSMFNISATLGSDTSNSPTSNDSNLGPVYPNGKPETKKEEKPKRTFPSDSNVYHFHPIAFVEHMKLLVTKEDIDLRPLMTFIPQSKGPSCNATCRMILKQLKLTPYGGDDTMQLGYEKKDGVEMIKGQTENALKYIDKALEYGHPVMVGVDHTFEYRKFGVINEGTTDHYVLIVGRKYESGKQFYIYWDVGTSRGASTEWKFEHRDDRLIADKTYKNPPKPFTVTQVRKNIGYDYE